jgi:hypothetical protein
MLPNQTTASLLAKRDGAVTVVVVVAAVAGMPMPTRQHLERCTITAVLERKPLPLQTVGGPSSTQHPNGWAAVEAEGRVTLLLRVVGVEVGVVCPLDGRTQEQCRRTVRNHSTNMDTRINSPLNRIINSC